MLSAQNSKKNPTFLLDKLEKDCILTICTNLEIGGKTMKVKEFVQKYANLDSDTVADLVIKEIDTEEKNSAERELYFAALAYSLAGENLNDVLDNNGYVFG